MDMMNKSNLRKLMLEKRKSILNKKELSTCIVDKLFELDVYKNSRVIALYYSLFDEVDTRDIIPRILNKKTVLLPKVIGDKMIFIKINKDTKYNKSNLGVLKPLGKEYSGNIDLIIVPGVSFDREHNRLGFGKGYYDKYLKDKDIYKIGICFNEQLTNTLPVDDYDIKMDLIITEKELI